MRQNNEYQLCKQVATYLRLQYPKVLFHFDLTGLNLSKAQAGMSKAIQHSKGWPDLFIAESRSETIENGDGSLDGELFLGLFIELKAEGTKLKNKYGDYKTPHLTEQAEMIEKLRDVGYRAEFGIGFDNVKKIIDNYLK